MKGAVVPSLRVLAVLSAAITGAAGSKCRPQSLVSLESLSTGGSALSTSTYPVLTTLSETTSSTSATSTASETTLLISPNSSSGSSSSSISTSPTSTASGTTSAASDTTWLASLNNGSSIGTAATSTASDTTSLARSSSGSGSSNISTSVTLTASDTAASTSYTSATGTDTTSSLSTSSASSISTRTSASSDVTSSVTSSTTVSVTASTTSTSSALSVTTLTTSSTTSSATTFNASDYTYYEVTLPVTFTSAVSVTTPTATVIYSITQTPTPSCVIDSSNMDATFTLAVYAGTPLIPKNGQIGLLESTDFPSQPDASDTDETVETVASEAGETANAEYFSNLPAWSFEETESGPSGYYDLVTVVDGASLYVALELATMEVHTSTSSTNGQQQDANGYITSIFSFLCNGSIVIGDTSGTAYTWQVGSDGVNTIMTEGSPATTDQILLVLTTMPIGYDANYTAYDSSLTRRHSRYGSVPELQRRESPYTDGSQPRVPYSPADLVSKPRPGVRSMEYNGCGSGSTSAWIPQLDFGTCCNYHDYCYDNCQSGQVELCTSQYCAPGEWERCNSAFYDCMHGSVCPSWSWFWHPISRAECELEALFYVGVVMTYLGADAFQEATSDRCGPYCPDGWPLCNGDCVDMDTDNDNCGACEYTCNTGALFACQDATCVCTAEIETDNDNCGGCGNVCPYKTHCSSASCACDDDTCGTLCVDMQSHPRNCGTCGNICSSGYCFEGECIDPDATATGTAAICLPTDAVTNGGFDTIQSTTEADPWLLSIGGAGIASLQFGSVIAGTVKSNVAIIAMENSVAAASNYFSLYQNISLCPGAEYEVTFTMALYREVETSSATPSAVAFSVSVLGNTVGSTSISTVTSALQGYGPYPFTVPASSDTFTFTNLELSFQIVQAATSSARVYYYFYVDEVSVYQP